ncbi:hypothetical protein CSUI_006347 [Cystoisospora suis]|uniref:Uncharacterized protein n=1 Tax=Cystoisospora suis TaxID=483139 RepID=A0A2C6KUE0_9APIC|nr:hypothetical protein CSUI_006347 [Cystoisospora suis]
MGRALLSPSASVLGVSLGVFVVAIRSLPQVAYAGASLRGSQGFATAGERPIFAGLFDGQAPVRQQQISLAPIPNPIAYSGVIPVDEPLGEDAVVENYSHLTALGLSDLSGEALPGGGLLEGATSQEQQSTAKLSRTESTAPSGVLEDGLFVGSFDADEKSVAHGEVPTFGGLKDAATGVVPMGDDLPEVSEIDAYVAEAAVGSGAPQRQYASGMVPSGSDQEAEFSVSEENQSLKTEKHMKAQSEGFSSAPEFSGDVIEDMDAESQQEASQPVHRETEHQKYFPAEIQEHVASTTERSADIPKTTTEAGTGALPTEVAGDEALTDSDVSNVISEYSKAPQAVETVSESGRLEESSIEEGLPLPHERSGGETKEETLPRGKPGMAEYEKETVLLTDETNTDVVSDDHNESEKHSVSSSHKTVDDKSVATKDLEGVQVETTETEGVSFAGKVHEITEPTKSGDETSRVESVTTDETDDREEVSIARQTDARFTKEDSRDTSGNFDTMEGEAGQLPVESLPVSFADVSMHHDEVSDVLHGDRAAVPHSGISTHTGAVRMADSEETHTKSTIEPVGAIDEVLGLSAEVPAVSAAPSHEAATVIGEAHMEPAVQGFLPPVQVHPSHHTEHAFVPGEEAMGVISVPTQHNNVDVHAGGVLPAPSSSHVLVSEGYHHDTTTVSHPMAADLAIPAAHLSHHVSPVHEVHQDHVIVDATGGHTVRPVGIIDHNSGGFLGAQIPSNVLPPMAAAMQAMHTPLVPQEGKHHLESLAPAVAVGKGFSAPPPIKVQPEVTVVSRGKKKGGNKKKSTPVVPVIEKAPQPLIMEHKPIVYEPTTIVEVVEKPRKKGRRVVS